MTKKEAEAYRRRWRLLEEVQRGEHHRLTVEDKLRQLDQCYQMAAELGLLKQYTVERRKGEKEVQLRWRRLKGLAA
jgi:predicted transcriptional regulator